MVPSVFERERKSQVIILGSSPRRDKVVSPDVEAKVRQLLARTELKDIAETAQVLVEISSEKP